MQDGQESWQDLQAEVLKQTEGRRSMSQIANPFRLPAESDVFGGREMEKRRRNVERHNMLHMSLIQRADLQKPKIPPCVTKSTTLMLRSSAVQSQVFPDQESRGVIQSKRMTEFVREKREIYLIQMIIDRQRNEIRKIQNQIQKSEEDAIWEEEHIKVMSKRYKVCHTQNEAVLARRRKRAEAATQRRVELQQNLKHALSTVTNIKTEIHKNQETLESYHLYEQFMKQMTPEGETTESYFDCPKKMINNLEAIEAASLNFIRSFYDYLQRFTSSASGLKDKEEEFQRLLRQMEALTGDIKEVEEIPETLNEKCAAQSRIQDNEYDKLRVLVEDAYLKCFGKSADINPMGMLLRIENQMESYYKRLDYIKPEFIDMKQQQIDKLRREQQRREKQLKQDAEQRVKMEQAIARANRPIQKHEGRPLVARTRLIKHENNNDKAKLEAMREQARLDEMLFGEITD